MTTQRPRPLLSAAPNVPFLLLCAGVLLLCLIGVPAATRSGVLGMAALLLGRALLDLAAARREAATADASEREEALAASSQEGAAPAPGRSGALPGGLLILAGTLLLLWNTFQIYRPILGTWVQRLGLA